MRGKLCRQCGEFKEASEFHRRSSSRDGLQTQCKPCQRAAVTRSKQAHKPGQYERQRQSTNDWRRRNRAHINQQRRTRYHTDPAYRAQVLAKRTERRKQRKDNPSNA